MQHYLPLWGRAIVENVVFSKFSASHLQMDHFLNIFFGGLECVGHSFANVAHLVFFGRCLDLNPDSCRGEFATKLATYF